MPLNKEIKPIIYGTKTYLHNYFKLVNTLLIQIDLFETIDGTLTCTTTLSQSGPGSNVNEGVTPHSSKLQQWNLTRGCSWVSYIEHT